jgi:hypothetical protein
MRKKLKIGQTVYLKPLHRREEVEQDVISKIGNKYFEVKGMSSIRFHIDTLIQDGRGYSPSWQVYLSSEDLKNEYEKVELLSYFKDVFDFGSHTTLSLSQLRRMKEITQEKE